MGCTAPPNWCIIFVMKWGLLTNLVVWLAMAVSAVAMDDVEYLKSRGPLSDDAFYRVLACNGASGETCESQLIKWAPHVRDNLTIAIAGVGEAFPKIKATEIASALDTAIQEINQIGAGLHLKRVQPEEGRAAIELFLVNAKSGGILNDVPSMMLRGARIQLGQVHVGYRENTIRAAHIAISRDIPLTHIRSVVLEEVVQALGLLTDILNPYYRHRSIFAEDCNCTTRLMDQDAVALRLHYPPRRPLH